MAMAMGIDLSLRSTALVNIKGNDVSYKLVTPSSKVYNDEELLLYNQREIRQYIKICVPDKIALEGLSFGSLSGSKDILAGNFWMIRTMIKQEFPDIELTIVPVLTWRSPLFTKEERKELKDNTEKVKLLKLEIAKLPKEDKQATLLQNEELIHRANIKYLTWLKVPEPHKSEFQKVGFNKGTFDLVDGYFLARHIG
jgi:hypothetical protein